MVGRLYLIDMACRWFYWINDVTRPDFYFDVGERISCGHYALKYVARGDESALNYFLQ